MSRATALVFALGFGCYDAPAARVPPVAVHAAPAPPVDVSPAAPVPPAEPPAQDAPSAHGVEPMVRFLTKGESRPPVTTMRFDPDAVPVAAWGEPLQGAGFRVSKLRDGWRLWVRTHVFAEVVVAAPPGNGGQIVFTAFTGGSFAQGDVPTCTASSTRTLAAIWSGFSPDGWTNQGLDVEMDVGELDLSTCSAAPSRSLHARAAALVPGYVYALRVEEGDDVPDKLVVFLPRGALVSAGGDPNAPIDTSNTGSFTRVSLPLARGVAGQAVVRISPASLALWSTLRATGAPVGSFDDKSEAHDDLQVSIDVSWQGPALLGTLSFAVPARKGAGAYAGLLAAAKR